MRLPVAPLNKLYDGLLKDMDFGILGCLSFEERSCAVPLRSEMATCKFVELVMIDDPADAFPDHSIEIQQKIEQNRKLLNQLKKAPKETKAGLLATEDELIDIANGFIESTMGLSSVMLDITSFPKRFFCFLTKRLLMADLKNVILTYTEPKQDGYSLGHLAEDPMTCDHLPGYAGPLPPRGSTLVVSVGFESLSIKPLMEMYGGEKKQTKIVLAFPPNGENTRRQWNTLRQMVTDPQEVRGNLEIIAAWDTEQVFRTLLRWSQDADGITLAPFGPKPHTLGMALFAIKHDAGLYYTQPKSYNPDYTKGMGTTWAYVVKWEGIPCYDRR